MSSEIAFEIETAEVFQPVVSVTELWMKTLENTTKDFGARVSEALSKKYGFSNEEALKFLGLESVAVNRKAMAKRSKSTKTKEPKEKKVKEPKEKKEKVLLPFTMNVDETLCHGIAYNHGLFTQCSKKPLENHSFCKGCQAQADKNANGEPDCGTIEARMASPASEYKDSKGRSPVAYSKIMKKFGYTKEQVEAEYGRPLDAVHFEEPEKKKTSGRPKKAADAVATSTDDIFNGLTADNGSEMGEEPKKEKKSKLTEEEKAEKKAKLEAERAEAKRLREEKEAAEKAERAEKRKAELEAKKAEREAKKEAEKAEKEAKKAEEKAKKAEEKALKEAQEKAEKEAKKAAKKSGSPVSPVVSETKVEEVKEVPKKKVGVVKIEIDGNTYYLNRETKILYDPKSKEEVGTYDEANKKLIPLPEEEDKEVEEEGYETD
jgi:hypothetical protein